jgi:hypothetical protein
MSAQLPDETVILDESSGAYYGLQGIGIRVWELIQQPRRIGEIVDTLAQEYDVAKERCREDVVALLEEMAERGLVALDYGSDK